MPQVLNPSEHVHAIFSALDARDGPALVAMMTDDVRMRLGNGDLVEGKAAFEQAVEAFFGSIAGIRHDVLHVWSDGDALIAELLVHYVRLDGDELTLPCCNVFRLRDGAVSDYRVYMDINPVFA